MPGILKFLCENCKGSSRFRESNYSRRMHFYKRATVIFILALFLCPASGYKNLNVPSFRKNQRVSNRSLQRCKCLQTKPDDAELTGYFQLPEIDSSSAYTSREYSSSYEDNDGPALNSEKIDEITKKRLYRQLLFAFDNYQESEIMDMSVKILQMPSQLSKILQLTIKAESIEAAAEKAGGFDEYLYDALRTTRSEIRMYGKDVEFFDDDGNDLRGFPSAPSFWPWNRKNK